MHRYAFKCSGCSPIIDVYDKITPNDWIKTTSRNTEDMYNGMTITTNKFPIFKFPISYLLAYPSSHAFLNGISNKTHEGASIVKKQQTSSPLNFQNLNWANQHSRAGGAISMNELVLNGVNWKGNLIYTSYAFSDWSATSFLSLPALNSARYL